MVTDMNLKKIVLYTAGLGIIGAVVFQFVYRPWNLTWGSTDEEVKRAMVGDDIVKDPTFNATRAVTIDARAEEVWPWIVQIGYKKAGFYSYDFLDNDRIASTEEIVPEFQGLQVGDSIPLDKNTFGRVEALAPNEHMLLVFEPDTRATWVWGLYETDGRTRLVTRLRWRTESRGVTLLLDAFEIIMMRKHLLGIKRRAQSLAQ